MIIRPLTGTALAAMLLPAAAVTADITHAEWASEDDYHFHVNFMPDLDQRRAGLPADGSMFCVPTATMNMFAYAAEWGFPILSPGPNIWYGELSHFEMTQRLAALGLLMDTGTNGTSASNWMSGTDTWLFGIPLAHEMNLKSEDYCPTLSNAAHAAAYGALVAVVYGRYNFNPGPIPVIGQRNGGHCVTVMHARKDGALEELWVRDPADGGSIINEAPWSMRIYDSVETRSIRQDWDDDSLYEELDATIIQYDPDGDQIRFIDKIYAIYPMSGWSWSTHELSFQPISDDFKWTQPMNPSFEPVPGFDFGAVAMGPGMSAYLTLQIAPDQDSELMALDRISGEGTRLGAGFADATDIVVGRHREIFMLAGPKLHALDLKGAVIETITMAVPGVAMAYRDATDEVLVLGGGAEWQLLSFERDLSPRATRLLPPVIPVSNEASMAVRDRDGAVAIHVPQTSQIVHAVLPLEPTGVEYSNLVLGLPVRSVAFDDGDSLVVAMEDSTVVEYAWSDDGWWMLDFVENGLYSNLAVAGAFDMMRSRTNYDPAINAQDDEDIPAEELAQLGVVVLDCPGDLDFDGIVGFADLLALLSAWGPCAGCPADFDQSDNVGFADLLIMLAGWGRCVP